MNDSKRLTADEVDRIKTILADLVPASLEPERRAMLFALADQAKAKTGTTPELPDIDQSNDQWWDKSSEDHRKHVLAFVVYIAGSPQYEISMKWDGCVDIRGDFGEEGTDDDGEYLHLCGGFDQFIGRLLVAREKARAHFGDKWPNQ